MDEMIPVSELVAEKIFDDFALAAIHAQSLARKYGSQTAVQKHGDCWQVHVTPFIVAAEADDQRHLEIETYLKEIDERKGRKARQEREQKRESHPSPEEIAKRVAEKLHPHAERRRRRERMLQGDETQDRLPNPADEEWKKEVLQELQGDQEDWVRSDGDGWYYSDRD